MLSEMAEKYQKETGEQAWVAVSGNDPEEDFAIHAYIEGPSNDYINWLEKRASDLSGSENKSDNKQSAFASQMPCSPCTVSRGCQDCDGVFGSASCAKLITQHFAHL